MTLRRNPLITDGKPDQKLLAETAKLYRMHIKKPGFVNQKRVEFDFETIASGGKGGWFGPDSRADRDFITKLGQQLWAWEHDLSLLVGEDRRPKELQKPKLALEERLSIPEIAGHARAAEHAVVVEDFNRNLAKLRRGSKVKDESMLFRFDCCDFQKLNFGSSPAKPDEKPKAIISDPPYLKEHVLRDPKKPNLPSLMEKFAAWCFQVLAKDGLVAVLFGGLWADEAVRIFKEAGFQRRWTLTTIYEGGNWARVRHRSVLSCSKPVLVFQRPGEQHGKIIEGDVIHCGKRSKSFHIWQQDVESFEQIVALLTDQKDLIVDPFGATGTTGIACLNLKRRFIGSEIDPKAHKTGLWRLQKCVHEGKTWRNGYQELRKSPTFDKLGNLKYGRKIVVGEDVGADGARCKVDE